MIPFFKELFEYSYHFNQKLAGLFVENQDQISEKPLKLFSHILNAQHIWNHRILALQARYTVWELHPVVDLMEIDQVNYEQTLKILDSMELNDIISYSNSKAQAFSNSKRDILFHVINHSTYHRGQIASELKRIGLEPLVTDFIFYKR